MIKRTRNRRARLSFALFCLWSDVTLGSSSLAECLRVIHQASAALAPSLDTSSLINQHRIIISRQFEEMGWRVERASIPQSISVNGRRFAVLAVLGEGAEGKTYLVTCGQEYFSAKVFRRDSLDRNLQGITQLQNDDVPVVKVLEADRKGSTLLLEYIPGINAGRLLQYPELYPLVSPPIITSLQHKLSDLKQKIAALPPPVTYSKWNILVDTRSGNLIVIDPF